MTNSMLGRPSPNQSSASGSNAIAGSGLNMAVSVDKRSVPNRVGYRNDRHDGSQRHANGIAHQQHADRRQRACQQFSVDDGVVEGKRSVAESRKQQRIVDPARIDFPGEDQWQQRRDAPKCRAVRQALPERQRTRDLAHRDRTVRSRCPHEFRPYRRQDTPGRIRSVICHRLLPSRLRLQIAGHECGSAIRERPCRRDRRGRNRRN